METKGKVGILVIALGRYTEFWHELYESCEKYFLPKWEKEYYVFTDASDLKYRNKKNVHPIYQKKLGWPFDTMMRFEMFLSQKEHLKKLDYLYFLNINLICIKPIGDEILPTSYNDGLMVCTHAGYYTKPIETYPYERNPNCKAYVPMGEGKHYAPGGFNGGTSAAFLALSEECSKNVRIDLQNRIIAQWHDESHLNKYILDKNPLIMPINYMYPKGVDWLEDSEYSKDIKMYLRDKANYGGHFYLRGVIEEKNTWFNKLKYKILRIIAKTPEQIEACEKMLFMLEFDKR